MANVRSWLSLDGALWLFVLGLLLVYPLYLQASIDGLSQTVWLKTGLMASLLVAAYGLIHRVFVAQQRFFAFVLFALSLPIGLLSLGEVTPLLALNFWLWMALFLYPWAQRPRAKGWGGFFVELMVLILWVGVPVWLLRGEIALLQGWAAWGAIALAVLPMAAYWLKTLAPFETSSKDAGRRFAGLMLILPWVAGLVAGVDVIWLLMLSWLGLSLVMAQMQARMSYDMLVLLPWMVFLVVLSLLPVFSSHEAQLTALYWQEWVFGSVVLMLILMAVKIEQRRKMTLVAGMTLILGYALLWPAMGLMA